MFRRIINSYGTTLYVQIWEKRLKVVDISTGEVFDEQPLLLIDKSDPKNLTVVSFGNKASSMLLKNNTEIINPFSHPRVLCADFFVAQKLLMVIFESLIKKTFLSPAPAVVMHPMEKLEGGLTMVERRVFRELAYGSGARNAVVHVGNELPIQNFNFDSIEPEIDY